MPRALPPTRLTFVAPMLPLPWARTSPFPASLHQQQAEGDAAAQKGAEAAESHWGWEWDSSPQVISTGGLHAARSAGQDRSI